MPTISQFLIAVLFVVAGVLHFLKPGSYTSTMPPWIPAHLTLVYVSGIFEILGGLGVMYAPVRAYAGWGLLALLLAVFPANIQMVINAHRDNVSITHMALLLVRLPLQPLMMFWVYVSTIRR